MMHKGGRIKFCCEASRKAARPTLLLIPRPSSFHTSRHAAVVTLGWAEVQLAALDFAGKSFELKQTAKAGRAFEGFELGRPTGSLRQLSPVSQQGTADR